MSVEMHWEAVIMSVWRYRGIVLATVPAQNRHVVKSTVQVINKPGLSIRVWFNRPHSTCLNWAGAQQVLQGIYL